MFSEAISHADFLACSQKTIIEIARNNGLDAVIIKRQRRTIRKGGKTEENLKWIEKIYPQYEFKKDELGNPYHEILIIEMRRNPH